MDIISGIASLFGGGLTALVGSAVQRVFEYKTKKLEIELQRDKYANELALKKADAEIMAQEWASRTQIANVEAKSKVDTEDSKAFNTALTSEPKKYYEGKEYTSKQKWMLILLDCVRGAIRPGLTIYLCFITTVIYFQVKGIVDTAILSNEAFDLANKIIDTILYLCTTCILFWFGTRNSK